MHINVTRSVLPPKEEYFEELASLWDSRWLTNMGEKHQTLERMLREYLGAPNVTLFTNGHLALEGALAAFGLRGEIITTPFTFTSTTNAIVRCGCRPVFCDVDPESYTLDPTKIEALITPETSAIVPVHVYGTLCDVEAIEAVAKKHGLKVIYDAAHAFGVKKNGVSAACFGDAAMFSFHATKVFHTVEGGCVVYKNPSLREKLNVGKNFGVCGEDILSPSPNAKMSEFHAAMGICNLRHLDEYISSRKQAAERYRRNLSGIPGLRLLKEQPGVESNYAYFPVVFDGAKYSRDEAAARLAEQEIFARKYFYPLTNHCTAYGFQGEETPIAKHISDRVLCLPLYPELAIDDVDQICEIICN
ncbi:MAG: DegT/DnrJ/EryC1/StrS family aminotransferase [Oscillospiraceae bacterium]|nr:DegT/DnrJ/EryC1/StrS family aminotransferase [Oscillospiraceae bacterium]